MLPGDTYVKGFLRTYADYLGLDGQLYLDEYNSRFATAEELSVSQSAAAPRKRGRRRVESNLVVVALAGIVAVTVLVVVGARGHRLGLGRRRRRSRARRPIRPPRRSRPGATTTDRGRDADAEPAKLVLTAARGDSFLQVRNGGVAGKLLWEGTLEQGQTQRFLKYRRLWIDLDDPQNLDARLNGAAVEDFPTDAGGRARHRRRASASFRPGVVERPRAVVVLTGSELVRGDKADANGSFLARELTGARPRAGADRSWSATIRPSWRQRCARVWRPISACSRAGSDRPTTTGPWRCSPVWPGASSAWTRAGRRDRGRLPRGRRSASGARTPTSSRASASRLRCRRARRSLGLAGTAPGGPPRARRRLAVALPGPPNELRRLWPRVLECDALRQLLADVETPTPPRPALLRPERVRGRARPRGGGRRGGRARGDGLRTGPRDPRRPVRAARGGGGGRSGSDAALRERFADDLFAEDERPVGELVLERCRRLGLTLATAESCTGGLVSARLTDVPGSSDVFLGGIVAYSNEAKDAAARGVPGRSSSATAPSPPRLRRRWPRERGRRSAPTPPSP